MDFNTFKQLIGGAFPQFPVNARDNGFNESYSAIIGFFVGDTCEDVGDYNAEISYDKHSGKFAIYVEAVGHDLTQEQVIAAMRTLLSGTTPEGGDQPVTLEDPDRPLRLGDRVTHVDRESPHWFRQGVVVGFVGICPRVYVDSPMNGSARVCRPERLSRVVDES